MIPRALRASHEPGDPDAAIASCDSGLTSLAEDVTALLDELARLRTATSELVDRQVEQEATLARQESELGELEAERTLAQERGAELDRLRAALAEQDRRVAELSVTREALSGRADPVPEEPAAVGHVRFIASYEGYRLTSSDERCIRPDEVVQIEGRSFVVTRIGRSPLPGDRRPCAFLQPHSAAA